MSYDREARYLHPFILHRLESILDRIQLKLPAGFNCKLISAHRTPADQFQLFKKGRVFQAGVWVIRNRSQVVTHKDGFVSLSRHNYLPSTAIDIGIFDSQQRYVSADALYQQVQEGKHFGLDWGGDWHSFKDKPHLEIPAAAFFKKNILKDCGMIWQQYLQRAGTYNGALDGIFGQQSKEALERATGESERNLKAWDLLYSRFSIGQPTPIL